MKILKTFSLLTILLLSVSELVASGSAGVYAIVEKVVFEPNEQAPERIQIWGAFTLRDGGSGPVLTPQCGYLYFTLPPTQKEAALKEWADFKAIAGTGQAVAFGTFYYIGQFSDELISGPAGMPPYILVERPGAIPMAKKILRTESATPTSPDSYPANIGLIKLSSTGNLAGVVEQLKQALKRSGTK
jgi:hypothetical protein